MMAVFFPVMYCQLIERKEGFLVLTAIKLALVLVLLVMFLQVRQKILVVHLCFAFANFRTCHSLAFELSDFQVPFSLYDLGIIFFCGFEGFTTGRALQVAIFSKHGSFGATNWTVT